MNTTSEILKSLAPELLEEIDSTGAALVDKYEKLGIEVTDLLQKIGDEHAQALLRLEKARECLRSIASLNETASERANFDLTPQKRARATLKEIGEG